MLDGRISGTHVVIAGECPYTGDLALKGSGSVPRYHSDT